MIIFQLEIVLFLEASFPNEQVYVCMYKRTMHVNFLQPLHLGNMIDLFLTTLYEP